MVSSLRRLGVKSADAPEAPTRSGGDRRRLREPRPGRGPHGRQLVSAALEDRPRPGVLVMRGDCLLRVAIHASAGVVPAGIAVGVSRVGRSQSWTISATNGIGSGIRNFLVVLHGAGVVVLPRPRGALPHRARKRLIWSTEFGPSKQGEPGCESRSKWREFHRENQLLGEHPGIYGEAAPPNGGFLP